MCEKTRGSSVPSSAGGRVSTEFRRHGIPRNFLTSEVISAQFRRNSAKFRGISPELHRKSLPYSAECQNVTSVDTLAGGLEFARPVVRQINPLYWPSFIPENHVFSSSLRNLFPFILNNCSSHLILINFIWNLTYLTKLFIKSRSGKKNFLHFYLSLFHKHLGDFLYCYIKNQKSWKEVKMCNIYELNK